jgi:PAS domain S-box-containing protein
MEMRKSNWIWEVDKDGTYTYVDPKIEDILGYKPDEVLGKTPFDLMPMEESVSIKSTFKNIVENSQPIVALKNLNQHKEGQIVVLETNGVPLFDDTGNVTHYRGFDLDVTGMITIRKEALEAREKVIGMLQDTLDNVKVLYGTLSICSMCQKIKDDEGHWELFESFIEKHTPEKSSSCVCPDCLNDILRNLEN